MEAKRRAEEAKADFMVRKYIRKHKLMYVFTLSLYLQSNLDDKLKSNPNLLFDMLGASEKIALLGRQNEGLLHSLQMLEDENAVLREEAARYKADIAELRRAVTIAPMRRDVCSLAPGQSVTMSMSPAHDEEEVGSLGIFLDTSQTMDDASAKDLRIVAEDENVQNDCWVTVNGKENMTVHRSRILMAARDGEEKLKSMMNSQLTDRHDLSDKIATCQGVISHLQEKIQELLAEKNQAHRAQLTASSSRDRDITGQNLAVRAVSTQIDLLHSKIKRLHEELSIEKTHLETLQKQYDDCDGTDASSVAELSGLRQIILYMTQLMEGKEESLDLVPDGDAQWAVQDLNQKNAALADELRRVKQRFSSVLGKMEAFSLTKFRTGSAPAGDGGAADSGVSTALPSKVRIPVMSMRSGSGSFSPPQRGNSMQIPVWTSDITSAVKAWSRQGRKDISFIVTVRAVGVDVRDWTLIKTFPDFKGLRAKMKVFTGDASQSLTPSPYYLIAVIPIECLCYLLTTLIMATQML